MSGKARQATAHTMATGDATMGKKKQAFNIRFTVVEDRSAEIARNLARRELEKVFAKHGVVCENWDEVLPNHMTGEMRNEQKEG